MELYLYRHDSRLERKLKAILIRRESDRLPVTLTAISDRLDAYWPERHRDSRGRFVKRYH